eukprot:46030-Rhodomonas_salina.3
MSVPENAWRMRSTIARILPAHTWKTVHRIAPTKPQIEQMSVTFGARMMGYLCPTYFSTRSIIASGSGGRSNGTRSQT